ncbi:MAG: ATP-binding protein [Gemmatimonadaceae bacterium]|nr:ATP-binding protein [Gemmatimonadaceae bacterium]
MSADVLIGELSHAASLGTLDAALAPFLQPHVLVLDEIGYLVHAADAANVLYRVVNERYLRQLPILVTTQKPLSTWGHVLHDGALAEAIIDRLLERGAHFEMRAAPIAPAISRRPAAATAPTRSTRHGSGCDRISRKCATAYRELSPRIDTVRLFWQRMGNLGVRALSSSRSIVSFRLAVQRRPMGIVCFIHIVSQAPRE